MAMSGLHISLLAALTVWVSSGSAQQFSGLPYSISYPGYSDRCIAALNTTVQCPWFLDQVSLPNDIELSSDQLDQLCVDACSSSLTSARSAIQSSCTSKNETFVYENIAYPATFVAENYLYTYNLLCRKDKTSGQYCEEILSQWTNQSSLTQQQMCSDCWLGVESIQLSSPLGYDAQLADSFASMTQNCSAAGYSYTKPTPIGLNGTSTSVSSPSTTSSTAAAPTCTGSYAVKDGDTCNSVALRNNVSTFSLLFDNGLNPQCNDFPGAGTELCIPPQCSIYQVMQSDTCEGIAQAHSATLTQLKAWNGNLNMGCSNLYQSWFNYICVSVPGGSYDSNTSSNLSVSTALSAAPAPTNAMTGSNRNCGKWYTVQDGDTCSLVSVASYLSLSDFYFLNPEIDENCTNLELGEAYCVAPVGDISTYSKYSTTGAPPITIAPETFTPVQSTISSTAATGTPVSPPSTLPMAPGTNSGCSTYRNYVAPDEASSPATNSNFSLNGCEYVASLYGIPVASLLAWNPSISSDDCVLKEGYSYCVEKAESSPPNTSPAYCLQVNETMSNTVGSCSCFTGVYGYQSDSYDCAALCKDFAITVSQLTQWNGWIGSGDCTTGLYSNLGYQDSRAVCIGVNASTPTDTATKPPGGTPTSTGAMGPTQTGVVKGCQQFYTIQSGDSCASVDAQFGISFDQLYAWNPSVGSNCENLWVGYAYCVEGPSSTTTAPATTAPPGAPTQSGIASGCTQYYTVQSGDSCAKIEDTYSVTFQQLYKWNPAIGSNCESLWVGYAVCVAAPSASRK